MKQKHYLLAGLGLALVGCLDANPTTDEQAVDKQQQKLTAHVCADPGPGEARCHSHVVVDPDGGVHTNAAPSGFGPGDLTDAYNVPASTSTATVAIVDAYGYSHAESDLATYRSQFGLPPCTTANGCFKKVNQNGVQGQYPRDDTGWSQESALDLDMVSAMCPSCRIILVEASSASLANLAAAEDTAVSLGATVVSNSYGGGESGSSTYESHYNHPGVAITVSSGDSGFGVQFPASSPHVTAVGGTSLRRDGSARGWSETAWSGAGAGCSTTYAKPSWQTDGGCANRTVADVSAIADPNTGVAVFGPVRKNSSGWLVFGGTSVAAPLIGGIYGASGTSPTAQSLYSNASSLNDVTSGSDGSCSGSYLCTAGAGYDGPTGLGTPNGFAGF